MGWFSGKKPPKVKQDNLHEPYEEEYPHRQYEGDAAFKDDPYVPPTARMLRQQQGTFTRFIERMNTLDSVPLPDGRVYCQECEGFYFPHQHES